jgi:hypothetical protein
MRQLLSKGDVQTLSSVLAVVLLLSSLPLTNGIVIVSGPGRPEFTINICQPLQTLIHGPVILLARTTALSTDFAPLRDWGPITVAGPALMDRRVPPDTPPPKSLC